MTYLTGNSKIPVSKISWKAPLAILPACCSTYLPYKYSDSFLSVSSSVYLQESNLTYFPKHLIKAAIGNFYQANKLALAVA